jgi:hypothetical protein
MGNNGPKNGYLPNGKERKKRGSKVNGRWCLFNDVFNCSDCTASNDMIIKE